MKIPYYLKALIFLFLSLVVQNIWARVPVAGHISHQANSTAPAINSFAPTTGPAGTVVTITGTAFNTTAANNIVFFGATRANVTTASATSLTVTVPTGATYASITVLNVSTGLAVYSTKFFLPTFTPNKGSITALDIAPKVDFTTGSIPVFGAIGDIDGDGKPDLIIANSGSNTVSVLRNTGSPGSANFAAKQDLPTGSDPQSVAIGDIDGDGKPDMVIANSGSNTVSVFLNTGSPGIVSFAAKVDLATGSVPYSVAIGDIDGDGKPDLVITNYGSNLVSVLLNTGSQGSVSFSSKTDFATGSGPVFAVIGDIDGDGKADLSVANSSSNTVSVFLNTGNPGSVSFATKVDLTTGSSPYSVAIGDIDGDGKPDLVTANGDSNTVSVLHNTGGPGSVSFTAKTDFTTGQLPISIAIGDIDGDGKPDLVIANDNSNTVSVLRNTGSPGSISFAAKVDIGTGTHPQFVGIGDLDGDGKADLAVANNGSATVSVLRNNPVMSLAITAFSPASGPVGTSVTITGTSFNTTVANNIVFFGATQATVTVASATSLTVTVPTGATYAAITVLNTTTGLAAYSDAFFLPTFTPNKGSITATDITPKVDFATGQQPHSVAISDIDGDGKPDLVIANRIDNTVSILLNTGNPGSVSFATKIDLAMGSSPVSVAIGDIDGDGKPDLVIANDGNNSYVAVLRNTGRPGSVSFAAEADFTTESNPSAVAIGDIDGDGKPDLAVANYFNNTVSVFRNTGSPGSVNFAAKMDLATGSEPQSVAIGDIDGDGKPDLAVANINSNTVSVLRNTGSPGSISFAAKTDLATGSEPQSVAIGDIDGDGKPDLAVANENSATVSVLRNTSSPGSVSFAPKVDFTTGFDPESVAIGDIDGDGKPDLAVANANNTVSVLRNTGSPGSASFATKVDLAAGSEPVSIAIGDIDGDGKPDLAVANFASVTVSVLRNNPAATVPPPTITSFGPTTGPVGTLVTITGTNLSNPTAFTIGGATAVVVSNTGTQMVGLVMPGAVTGSLSITSAGGTALGGTFTVTATSFPVVQQGAKLVGTGGIGSPEQGYAVAISADGNTAVVGGSEDNNGQGAIWIYSRNNGAWVQQGAKLVGTGNVGGAEQGTSVAISADGNTVIEGGRQDGGGVGDAWVFTRSNGTWAQQGAKLPLGSLLSTASVEPNMGQSVALSADGNTALVGATQYTYFDNTANVSENTGAGAIYTRSGSTWQQGALLVAPVSAGNSSNIVQGSSVALSADGNTAVVGGIGVNSSNGAAWVYTKSSGAWQAGVKLAPTDAVGIAWFGYSSALSADGNTAIIGGPNDNGSVGAAWIFTRSGSTWAQQGPKLIGTVNPSTGTQGNGVGLSADGNTAVVGEYKVPEGVWVYTRSGTTWTKHLNKLDGSTTSSGGVANEGYSVALSADGKTMIEGGVLDNTNFGAAWVFIAGSNNAALAGLTISSGTLSPAFATGTIAYTASVANTITSITVKPTTSDPTATVTVNGITVSSGSASTAIPLNAGANIITTRVTAQDGMTTSAYTIVVTRALPAAPNISYAGPQTYTAGIAITALSPVNAGGAVPVAAYGKTTTLYQGGSGILNAPAGIAVDVQGNVYSSAHHTIYKITPAGVISVLAGSGVAGNNNAQGTLASFNAPIGIAVDGQGNVYVADSGNNLIREISPSGLVSTLAGNGAAVIKDGPNLTASFNDPAGVAVDNAGNVYVVDIQSDANGNYGIRKISTSGMVSTIAYPTSQFGGTWGAGNGAINPLNSFALTVDAAGNVYVTGGSGGVIDKVTPAGVVSTFAGNFGVQSELDGTPDKATFSNPVGLAADAAGNLYVSNNSTVRKVTPQGVVSTLAGSYPGQGAVDGTGGTASFSLNPGGIAVDGQGNVYLADNGNLSVRKISAVGYALNTSLPQGLAFDATKGTISGTPGAASPAANYSISAYNLGGGGSATLNITVGASANLAKLVLSAGALSPVFATNTSSYSASVASTVTSVTITPTASDATATITVNGTSVKSATASQAIPLSIGPNTITTVITGSDGTTTKTYTVTVTRTGSTDALLTSLKLTPASTLSVVTGPSYVNYATTVAATTNSITVTATEQDPTATLTVNGITTASDVASAPIALTAGSNVINIVSTAQDGLTTKTYTITATKAASANASLSLLKISSGVLSPVFATGTTSYTASVTNTTTSVTITPTAADATATIMVNGTAVISGTASAAIPLTVGANIITTKLTAQNGTTTSTYTITVTRAGSTDALLTSVKLTPASTLTVVTGPSYVNYTTTVAASTSSVTVTATEQEPTATLKVNGVTTTPGTASAPITLVAGSNVINIVSTAQDGVTTKTYTITATKPASAGLSVLKISTGTLTPVFATATTSYTTSVANAVTSITVTPTASDGTGTIKVNGTAVVSGAASAAIPLTAGPNTITIVVTDGGATKTYTITVTRAPSTDALLTSVKLTPASTLTVVTGPSYVNYTTTVAASTSSVTVTATEQDPTATLKINGTVTTSGAASASIPITTGTNVISIVSIAQDGVTTKTYTITATKPASASLSALKISSGTLAPVFATAITSYTASVTNAATSITVTPTTGDGAATIKVNGTVVTSGVASTAIPLAAGKNTITIVVTDGTASQTYVVAVTRAASTDALLTALKLTPVSTLTVVTGPSSVNYTTTVAAATSSVTVTATEQDPTATIKINGVTTASGTASAPIALTAGSNVINIVSTAQDGITTETYTITVTRPATLPNISYAGPQAYIAGTTIAPLAPVNTGGAVPATVYAQVSTFAGNTAGGALNGTGTAASFHGPSGITMDASQNIYVADFGNNLIRKITPAGVVSTFAGSGAAGSSNGTGTAASFNGPNGIGFDASGNMYVAEQYNNMVRKITPAGVVSTFAGSGAPGSSNGTGTAASFQSPAGLAVDAAGNVYVADENNQLIRKITPAGVVSTLAGNNGVTGALNGTGTAATFNYPWGVAVDGAGNVYVADNNNSLIRKITPAGVVSTLAGSVRIGSADGIGTAAGFEFPFGLTVDAAGTIYVADQGSNRIRKITQGAVVTTLAGSFATGSVNGIGVAASFSGPYDVAVDAAGNVYVTDAINNLIRKIVNTGYSISPALPPGLVFDSTTGIISGTPTAAGGAITYTITGYNLAGSSSATVSININSSAQAPVISYAGPQTYISGTAITALSPVNTGGTVPATAYGQVNSFAGSSTTGSANGTGTAAGFNLPAGIATDAAGNFYVADAGNNLVRKITPAGVVTTLAGSGTAGSANGTGAAASFNEPNGIAVDAAGNVYVADAQNNMVRKITPGGVVSTFASGLNFPADVAVDASGNVYEAEGGGTSINKISPAGVVSVYATGFSSPFGIAVDKAGNVYTTDYTDRVFEINSAGVISVLAGSGTASFANGTGTAASFNNPNGLKVDAFGDVYVADTNNGMIRKISPSGVVTTVASAGTFYLAIDAAGNLFNSNGTSQVQKIFLSGYTISPALPAGLAFDSATGIISGKPTAPSAATNYNITAYNTAGSSTAIVGITVNGVLQLPAISYPGPQVFTAGTNVAPLAPANTGGPVPATIYGQVATFAGATASGSLNGTGTAASFFGPLGAATDAAGNLYVADEDNNLIRKITPAGVVSTFAGSGAQGSANGAATVASFYHPTGLAVDGSGNIYVADQSNNLIRKITAAGVVSTFAGSGSVGSANGTGTAASFNLPTVIALDTKGNLYVTDLLNNLIRKITSAGVVTTFAGSGAAGSTNGTGTAASFKLPTGITLDAAGNIYVADQGNHLIRKVTAAGVVSTLAGSGVAGSANGTGTAASFYNPYAVAVDGKGNIYVADYNNNEIRLITSAGVVSTFAGTTTAGSADGLGAGAGFNHPSNVALDNLGNLYVSDYYNNEIRKINLTGYTISPALPLGVEFTTLGFDGTTGIFSGTPLIIMPLTTYTITAYNASGSSTTTLNITVNGAAVTSAVLSYAGPQTYNLGTAIPALTPANSGGAIPSVAQLAVSTFAGSGAMGAANGTGAGATFNLSSGNIATDNSGNVYVADQGNSLIRKITPAGLVTTLAGSGARAIVNGTGTAASFSTPTGIAVDASGNVYVSDFNVIRKITPAGVVTTLAGGYTGATSQDGTGAGASFDGNLQGITVDASGNIYVSEPNLGKIREVSPGGVVTTLISNINNNSLRLIWSLAIDKAGNVYGACFVDQTIIKVTPAGVFSIFAGTENVAGHTNGTGTAATFNFPEGITIDATGNLYVADANNSLIRKITAAGVVTTFAGNMERGLTNSTATGSAFGNPTNVATDPSGNIYVFDSGDNMIRKIGTTGYVIAPALPPGLNINPNTGVISGTPGALSATSTYTVSAYNSGGSATATVSIGVVSNANLSKLAISSGTLSPVFATATTAYTASVANATSTITVTPTTGDGAAMIKVNGSVVASGTASAAIPLLVGSNTITTVVTDGTATQTYTITVTRAASTDALLTSVKLTPASTLTVSTGPSYVNYTTSVPNTTSSFTVTATEQDLTATIKVNGITTASGTASAPIALAVGSNTINIVSTAQDGVTSKTYTIIATRAAASGANSLDHLVSVTKPTDSPAIENDGVTVHQGVSPNGDGINDYLTIDNITNYPDNNLMIIDRNGVMVYQAKGYDNRSKLFDGHSNISGKMQLPGTYFYTLDYAVNGETKHKTGFIILKY